VIEMHVCFRGGTGDSRVARSISVIRGFTKNVRTSARACRRH
jgi:hypothetical protein